MRYTELYRCPEAYFTENELCILGMRKQSTNSRFSPDQLEFIYGFTIVAQFLHSSRISDLC